MLLMRTNPLQGQVGGDWTLEIDPFFALKWHRAVWKCHLGPKNVSYLIISWRKFKGTIKKDPDKTFIFSFLVQI
jgi:hypothetical protein